jgi:hypothetical protein
MIISCRNIYIKSIMSKANVATARSKIGKVYATGCTGFVADVLGLPQKHSSLWKQGDAVEKSDLNGGDVVGWIQREDEDHDYDAHVVIFDGSKYLNCPGPGKAVKENVNMGRQLYRISY